MPVFKRILSLSLLPFIMFLTACGSSDKAEPKEVILDLRLGSGDGSSFSEGDIAASQTALSSGESVQLRVNIVNANSGNALNTSEEVVVTFTSDCVALGAASLSDLSVTTSTGQAITTYTSSSCLGNDQVTAQLLNKEQTASIVLSTLEPSLGSLSAITPTNTVLAIKGFSTDTLPSTAEVSFRVLDQFGSPVVNKSVNFFLIGGTGGVNLSQSSDLSDSAGLVSTFVNSGTANTSFRVIAEADASNGGSPSAGQTMQTTSTAMSVTTGLPVAHNFGSAVSVFNPRGWNYVSSAGDGVAISATASDLFGGAVVDGNTVTFSTYGGRLEESSCVLENGSCSVLWQSSEAYRPIATMLAYTLGEESFEDANGNGQFDVGEVFTPLAEPLRDDNRDGDYDSGEFFVDSNNNGEWDDAISDYRNTVYRGGTCSDAAKSIGHCASLAYIYSQPAVVMSSIDGISVLINGGNAVTIPADTGVSYFEVLITDENGAIPPAGSELSITCNGSDISSNNDQMPAEIPNEFSPTGFAALFNVTAERLENPGSPTAESRSATCFVNVIPEDTIGVGISFTVIYQVDTGAL